MEGSGFTIRPVSASIVVASSVGEYPCDRYGRLQRNLLRLPKVKPEKGVLQILSQEHDSDELTTVLYGSVSHDRPLW